jgi:putative transposase
MDFARDQLFNGRKICILTVVDTYSRFTPAIEARQSFKGTDVVTALENAALEVG